MDRLPTELRLRVLEATASVSLKDLHNLQKTCRYFDSIYKAYKRSLILAALPPMDSFWKFIFLTEIATTHWREPNFDIKILKESFSPQKITLDHLQTAYREHAFTTSISHALYHLQTVDEALEYRLLPSYFRSDLAIIQTYRFRFRSECLPGNGQRGPVTLLMREGYFVTIHEIFPELAEDLVDLLAVDRPFDDLVILWIMGPGFGGLQSGLRRKLLSEFKYLLNGNGGCANEELGYDVTQRMFSQRLLERISVEYESFYDLVHGYAGGVFTEAQGRLLSWAAKEAVKYCYDDHPEELENAIRYTWVGE